MDDLVEVSKSLLNQLQGTAKVANALWNDDKVGMINKERTKELFPNATIPEVDAFRTVKKSETEILAKVEAKEKALEDRISAFERTQKERDEKDASLKAEREFANDVESTKKKYQLTAEGMEKVFARMKEKNNPDVEAAAAWVTDHEPKQSPLINSSYSPQSMDVFGSSSGKDEFKEINDHAFDGKWFDKEVRKINEDFLNGRGGLYGADGMGGQL
jgi:predicted trehalose synthase